MIFFALITILLEISHGEMQRCTLKPTQMTASSLMQAKKSVKPTCSGKVIFLRAVAARVRKFYVRTFGVLTVGLKYYSHREP